MLLLLAIITASVTSVRTADPEILAKTPPMGWNAWNRYGCEATEDIIKKVADDLVSSGLKSAGYEYLNLDDCWQVARHPESKKILVDSERFPSGLASLSKYIHGKGLKFGIYSSAGSKTCQKRPGSLGYEEIDAKTYAEWQVDYLKYDNCHNEFKITKSASIKRYKDMADALKKTKRPIVYSICNWGQAQPWLWAPEFSQLWRTTADIGNTWNSFNLKCSPCLNKDPSTCIYFGSDCSITNILDKQVTLTEFSRPGGWNDMDMLQIGNGGLTREEEKSHFSLWAALKSPLIIGTDLSNITSSSLEVLMNKEVIAVNQDSLGISARLVKRETTSAFMGIKSKILYDIWGGPLSKNRFVVILFNRDDTTQDIFFRFKDLGIPTDRQWKVRDLWKHKDLGQTVNSWIGEDVAPHGVQMLLISPAFLW